MCMSTRNSLKQYFTLLKAVQYSGINTPSRPPDRSISNIYSGKCNCLMNGVGTDVLEPIGQVFGRR